MKLKRFLNQRAAVRLALPLLCTIPAGIQAAAFYESGSGISDTGVVLGATPQSMTSYSGLEVYAAGSSSTPVNSVYLNIPTVGFTLSEPADAQFAVNGADVNSPSGLRGHNFLFTLGRNLLFGETFSVDFDFPNDWTYSTHSPSTPSVTQGTVPSGVVGQKAPGATAFDNPFTIAGRTEHNGSSISSPGAEIMITGVLNDGTAPDLSGIPYAPGTMLNLFNWINDGDSISLQNGNSEVVFTDDGDSDGLGGALRLQSTFAWQSQTLQWRAGQDGLPAGTIFRVSLDGAALVVENATTIPEPSRASLMALAFLTIGLRRRR